MLILNDFCHLKVGVNGKTAEILYFIADKIIVEFKTLLNGVFLPICNELLC